MSMILSPYEVQQLERLQRWQQQSPGWGSRLMAKPGGKVAQAVQALIPEDALRAALDGVSRLAEKLADERAILKRAGVNELSTLREGELSHCDALMRSEQRRAMALAGVGGAAFGVAGATGMVADIPALIALSLRTIQRVSLCYGDPGSNEMRRRLSIGVFALASANSAEEKRSALVALRSFDQSALQAAAWRDGVERVAERELTKEATVFSLKNLAQRLGIHLGKRKAAGAVPVVGALVGSSVNAWYLYDLAQVARYVFQERWLIARYPQAPQILAIQPAISDDTAVLQAPDS